MTRILLWHPNVDEVLLLPSNSNTAFDYMSPKVRNSNAIEQNAAMV